MEKNVGMHPIGVVAERAGLTPDLVRMWERRYGVVEPVRDPAGRRVYSDADIERLRLLARATAAGRNIGQISDLTMEELAGLVRGDESARWQSVRPPEASSSGAAEVVEHALRCARSLDAAGLEATLRRAHSTLGAVALVEEVAAPLFRRIGEEWHAGRLAPAHEHLASGVVRPFLAQVRAQLPVAASAPVLVVASPSGDRHEVGALLVAAAAAVEGWGVLYLGPDLPAEEIARAAIEKGALAVALSVVYVPDPKAASGEIVELRRRLPAGVPLLLGGGGVKALGGGVAGAGTFVLPDLAALRSRLRNVGAEAA
jgi:MerR family transcriptional regulator, light-induced transcriptional regulator